MGLKSQWGGRLLYKSGLVSISALDGGVMFCHEAAFILPVDAIVDAEWVARTNGL